MCFINDQCVDMEFLLSLASRQRMLRIGELLENLIFPEFIS